MPSKTAHTTMNEATSVLANGVERRACHFCRPVRGMEREVFALVTATEWGVSAETPLLTQTLENSIRLSETSPAGGQGPTRRNRYSTRWRGSSSRRGTSGLWDT